MKKAIQTFLFWQWLCIIHLSVLLYCVSHSNSILYLNYDNFLLPYVLFRSVWKTSDSNSIEAVQRIRSCCCLLCWILPFGNFGNDPNLACLGQSCYILLMQWNLILQLTLCNLRRMYLTGDFNARCQVWFLWHLSRDSDRNTSFSFIRTGLLITDHVVLSFCLFIFKKLSKYSFKI